MYDSVAQIEMKKQKSMQIVNSMSNQLPRYLLPIQTSSTLPHAQGKHLGKIQQQYFLDLTQSSFQWAQGQLFWHISYQNKGGEGKIWEA